ncbi:MAG: guanylate kinase [Flavobacteriales bacterium]
MNQKCVIFSAPSGAGKTTIVKYLLGCNIGLQFSISATSRPKREQEVHAQDYYFLSVDEFKQKIANDEFVEWEEVYTNNFYGTLKSEIERIWANGKAVIFDVDVEGGINLKKAFGDKAMSIFVKPPSVVSLEKRLRTRATETEDSITRRMAKATQELGYADKFDVILLNDDLDTVCFEAKQVVKQFLDK